MKNRKKKEQTYSVLYIRHIPTSLKSYFKAYCAKREKTMNEVIITYMKEIAYTTPQPSPVTTRTKVKKKDQRTTPIYIHEVPANLKKRFKKYCLKREMTMSDVIIEYMKEVTQTARMIDESEVA
jgi:hypothetical protein